MERLSSQRIGWIHRLAIIHYFIFIFFSLRVVSCLSLKLITSALQLIKFEDLTFCFFFFYHSDESEGMDEK